MAKYYISHVRMEEHSIFSGVTIIDYWADSPWCAWWHSRDPFVTTYYKPGASRPSRPFVGGFTSIERAILDDSRRKRFWFFHPLRRFSSRSVKLRAF